MDLVKQIEVLYVSYLIVITFICSTNRSNYGNMLIVYLIEINLVIIEIV